MSVDLGINLTDGQATHLVQVGIGNAARTEAEQTVLLGLARILDVGNDFVSWAKRVEATWLWLRCESCDDVFTKPSQGSPPRWCFKCRTAASAMDAVEADDADEAVRS
jgi:hypothetical protein